MPLYSGETPPGLLCSALEPSAQERHGPAGVSPEEDHKNDLMSGTPVLRGTGVVGPGEDKALQTPNSSLSVPEGGL